MLKSLVALLASTAVASSVGDGFEHLAKRALGPISTSNPNAVAGGSVANSGGPVTSFFSGLTGAVS